MTVSRKLSSAVRVGADRNLDSHRFTEMGVTKERIRQLEARALSKLRDAADEANIDVELVPEPSHSAWE